MSANSAILTEYEYDAAAVLDVIREMYNCREAKVDDVGDVWIADPQSGHWLTAEDLADLVRFGREAHGWPA